MPWTSESAGGVGVLVSIEGNGFDSSADFDAIKTSFKDSKDDSLTNNVGGITATGVTAVDSATSFTVFSLEAPEAGLSPETVVARDSRTF